MGEGAHRTTTSATSSTSPPPTALQRDEATGAERRPLSGGREPRDTTIEATLRRELTEEVPGSYLCDPRGDGRRSAESAGHSRRDAGVPRRGDAGADPAPVRVRQVSVGGVAGRDHALQDDGRVIGRLDDHLAGLDSDVLSATESDLVSCRRPSDSVGGRVRSASMDTLGVVVRPPGWSRTRRDCGGRGCGAACACCIGPRPI